jgi:hypothetical protein
MDYFLHAPLPCGPSPHEMDYIPDECYRDIGQEPPRVVEFDIDEDDDIQF